MLIDTRYRLRDSMDAELFVIQPALAEPIYRQIEQQVKRRVASGRLQNGKPLPSVREIAAHHAINPITVSRAYRALEAEHVLERHRGKGMVVAAARNRRLSDEQRLQHIEPGLRELARQVRELDLPARSVIARLRALLEEGGLT
jgi:GntR family transcriptional regulator